MIPIYVFISRKLFQIENLYRFLYNNNSNDAKTKEKIDYCYQEIEDCIKNYFPNGSGFDFGTKLIYSSTPEKIRFQADFHHMDEHGYYYGWTEHVVTVKPSLGYGYSLHISGKNRNEIKEYISDCFNNALNGMVDEHFGKHQGN